MSPATLTRPPALRAPLLAALLVALLAPSAGAQVLGEPEAQGTAFYSYAEPGAPLFEVVLIGQGIRNGIYRFQEGTSLTEVLALAGGVAASDSTGGLRQQVVTTSHVRVFRPLPDGGVRLVYEATPEALVREPARHPVLQTGDVVEADVEAVVYELDEPFTFRDGLELTARLASVISVVILLINQL